MGDQNFEGQNLDLDPSSISSFIQDFPDGGSGGFFFSVGYCITSEKLTQEFRPVRVGTSDLGGVGGGGWINRCQYISVIAYRDEYARFASFDPTYH